MIKISFSSVAELCYEHGYTAHHQKVMPHFRSALLRPPGMQSLVLGFQLDRCTGVSPEQGCLRLGCWRTWHGGLGLLALQNEDERDCHLQLSGQRSVEKRGFSEVHSSRTRGKGCGLERGKFRSGVMKTCPQLLVTGMDCTERLWDLHNWR